MKWILAVSTPVAGWVTADTRGGEMIEPIDAITSLINEWGGSCIYNCVECSQPDQHAVVDQIEPLPDAQGHKEICTSSGTCADHACEQAFAARDEAEQVESFLAQLGGHALMSLVQQDHRVTVNTARQAVQIAGCNDRIVLSVPLTEEQSRFLALN